METNLFAFIQTGFTLLTFISLFILYRMIRNAVHKTDFATNKKRRILTGFILALLSWALLVSGLSLSGILSDFSSFPPKMIIVLIVPLVTIVWAIRTKTFGEILIHIPADHIVKLQVFRVFVEVLLWLLVVANLLPAQMSFEGWNFDVLSGLTAPLIAYLLARNKISSKWLVVWNLVCLGLLINIVTIALLSMPTPFRFFMNEPANTIVAVFPIVLLPAFLVPLAYSLHLISLRQLGLLKRK